MTRFLICCIALLLAQGPSSARAEQVQFTFDMAGANWEGDGATGGGLDAGMKGDRSTLVASAKGAGGYPRRAEVTVNLPVDLTHEAEVTLEVGFRANAMQTNRGLIFWNGVEIGTIDGYDGHEVAKTALFVVPAEPLRLVAGEHVIAIEAAPSDNQWDFLQLDALRLTAGSDSDPTGGNLIAYELITFRDGNWPGDGNTWGGVDSIADVRGDLGALRVAATVDAPTASYEHAFRLSRDFTGGEVRATITYRRNAIMAGKGRVLINGQPLVSVTPIMPGEELGGRDSVLATETVLLPKEFHSLAPGRHTLTIEASDPGLRRSADFQIDSLLLEAIPDMDAPFLPIGNLVVAGDRSAIAGPVAIAMDKLQAAARELGSAFTAAGEQQPQLVLQDSAAVAELKSALDGAEAWQRRDAYLIRTNADNGRTRIDVAALEPHGLVFALSDLQVRLRRDGDGNVGLSLSPGSRLLEIPANDIRGEYVNVGYNVPGITPHEWDKARWEQYLDYLILSRLNTFYFYVWTDVYGIYPESENAKVPLNLNIHEGLRHAISYAKKRGMRVHFMATPSYGPADIWRKHPEAHADIDYVKYGFPAVCLNAPGAWERMKKIWAYEFEWFKEADVLQIWFYDPGGCFCEKHGCRTNQGEVMARQVREFGDMFRDLNPQAQIDFNLWPIWVWEERMGPYRADFHREIKKLFPDDSHRELGAVGAWGSDASLPLSEAELGFRTSNFIFGSNPESGYFFLMPNLAFHQQVMRDLKGTSFRNVFGHRLEVWTRLPATFFMAEMMWNPDVDPVAAVRRWAEWQTGGGEAAADLAESILLLEQFTSEGASLKTAGRARMVAERAMSSLTPSARLTLSHYPAMLRAMELMGRGASSQDSEALPAVADLFIEELRNEPLFAPMAGQGRGLFTKYVTLTAVGTKQRMF